MYLCPNVGIAMLSGLHYNHCASLSVRPLAVSEKVHYVAYIIKFCIGMLANII